MLTTNQKIHLIIGVIICLTALLAMNRQANVTPSFMTEKVGSEIVSVQISDTTTLHVQ